MRWSFRIDGAHGQEAAQSKTVRPWLILFFMAAVFGFMGLVFHFVSDSAAGDAALLEAEGKPAVATVTDQRVVESRDKDSDGDTRITVNYYITLSFKPEGDSAEVQTEALVPKARYDVLGVGDQVDIFYAASRPTLIELTRGETAANAGILRLVSYILWAVALGLAVLGVSLWRRARPKEDPVI